MLTAAISTFALASTRGPLLHAGLQAALDEAQPKTEASLELVAEPVAPEIISETPANEPPTIADPVIEMVSEETTAPRPEEPIILAQADTAEAETIEQAPVDTGEPVNIPAEPIEEVPTEVQSGELPAEEWPAILTATSAALSAAKTAKGNFIQTNPDGSITTGTFALNRPGRMRFDYDDPTPVLIVSDGTTVAMEDSELETVDRVPIGATPLGLILSTDLNVDEDVDVLSVMQSADRYGVRVEDASGELEGTLTIVFDKVSYELLGWLTTDGNLRTTVVDLTDVETNVRVDPRLFRLDDAEDEEEER